MVKYLVDTCIWRDFIEKRVSRTGNSLVDAAERFFEQIILHGDTLLISPVLDIELGRYAQDAAFLTLFQLLERQIVRIPIHSRDVDNAKALSDQRALPFNDCLLAVLAQRHHAIIVTQDKHFLRLQDICSTKTAYQF